MQHPAVNHYLQLVFIVSFMLCTTSSAFMTSAKKSVFDASRTAFESGSHTRRSISSRLNSVPKLIVFDLDNTLWTPELYQLRKLQRNKQFPVAYKDVKLFPAAWDIIQKIRNDPHDTFANTKFAVASRTQSGEWAHDLLKQFELYDWFDYIEIFSGDKQSHFRNLKESSGLDYKDMLFFDDARDGRYGNCERVSALGVLSVHCPNGLYEERIWDNALDHFKKWSVHSTPNSIVEWDGTIMTGTNSGSAIDPNKRFQGEIKFINREKRFGFIDYGAKGRNAKDMFFHFSALPYNQDVKEGDVLTFTVTKDARSGKNAAQDIEIVDDAGNANDNSDTVNMRVFSMNLPFAALLSNGYKTLETRNGTMFTPYPENTKMLLHVGQRTYPDGNRHLDVMRSGGLDDEEIAKLKSLPPGFKKGQAVAIVELGRTFETTLEERCDPDFQRSVGAFGADSGMRATEIKRVSYLKRGVKVPGSGGVFKAQIDKDAIPDGWLEDL